VPRALPRITITPSEIRLAAAGDKDQLVVKVHEWQVPPASKRDGATSYFITPLYEALRRAVAAAKAGARKAGRAFSGEVAILAEHRTLYRLLSEVLYTAGQAELFRVCLVVQGAAGDRHCRWVESPKYDAPARATGKHALNLVVAMTYSGFIVAGEGGVMKAPDGTVPTVRCKASLQQHRCPARLKGTGEQARWEDGYDYPALQKLAVQIKQRHPSERQAILSADKGIPYQQLIRLMDVLWGAQSSGCTGADGCLFDRFILAPGVQ
jgi:biopolymer transport protein ExbD